MGRRKDGFNRVADMKPRRKIPLSMDVMGLVGGVTLIVGFFMELLVFNRWRTGLAISGTIFTILFAYWLFFERHPS
jgi:hypothetical protein